VRIRLDSRMKFEYFVGKEIGKHGGERFEVNAGWWLRNRLTMLKLVDGVPELANI